MKRLISLCAVAALGVTLVACSKKEEQVSTAKAVSDSALLEYVPADSPYVFASLAPAPKSYLDKVQPLNEKIADSVATILDTVSAQAGASDDSDAEPAITALKLAKTALSILRPDTMKEFGMSPTSPGVIYGNGMLPVLRIALEQPEKFMPRFRALAEEQSWAIDDASAGGVDYASLAIGDEAAVAVAVADGMVVISVVPPGADEDLVATLLGASRPTRSLADSGTLTALGEQYDLIPQGIGYIDIQRFTNTFTGGATNPVDAMLMELAGGSPADALDEVCKSEIQSLAGVMPRMVLGYESMSGDGMDMLFVAELRDDIAAALQPVAGSVPGLTSDSTALMKFGFGLDMAGMRAFVGDKIAKFADSPYECEALAGMNMAAIQMVQAMNQPMPPIVNNFKGFFIELDNLDGIDLNNPSVPESIDANAVLAFDNVENLIAMGQMMLPPLAALEMSGDAKPVQIPQELLTGYAGEVFAAMSADVLALSSGNGAKASVGALASATGGADPVLMAMSVDMAGYMGLIGDIQESALDELDGMEGEKPESIEAMVEAQKDLTNAYVEVFDRETVIIKPTANGIEMPIQVTFR